MYRVLAAFVAHPQGWPSPPLDAGPVVASSCVVIGVHGCSLVGGSQPCGRGQCCACVGSGPLVLQMSAQVPQEDKATLGLLACGRETACTSH